MIILWILPVLLHRSTAFMFGGQLFSEWTLSGLSVDSEWIHNTKVSVCDDNEFPQILAELPWIEQHHSPPMEGLSKFVNGTDTEITETWKSPDYRMEEKMLIVYNQDFFKERERPYRLSPHYYQTSRWVGIENAGNLGCYCTTVYKRHICLSGCAVITTRHILTTATPTELMLRAYGHRSTLVNIMGAWYDHDAKLYNSSMYMTPARIHIHPMYRYDYEVNVSHPLPVMYDLSVWASTHKFLEPNIFGLGNKAILCYRGVSGTFEYASSIPRANDLAVVVGFQFMKSYRRRPMPWFKYGVRTKSHVYPCPKSDWQWYHCILGGYWGKFGFDSGGALHIMIQNRWWEFRRVDGFIGMCSFSMTLRAKQVCHYFTVVDNDPVLNFLYDAYLGRQKYKWLDGRFEDSQWRAPVPYWGEHIENHEIYGVEYMSSIKWPLVYRR